MHWGTRHKAQGTQCTMVFWPYALRRVPCTLKHFFVPISFPLFLSACFVLLVCSTGLGDTIGPNIQSELSEENTPKVSVERSDLDNTTIYRISRGDCAIEWIIRDSEEQVVKHSSRCAAPLAEQLPLMKKIASKFFSGDKNARAFRTLFWGTLESETKPVSLEMPLRLALAAHRSPGWDARKGEPKNGDINGFVRDLANQGPIYPELKTLFEHFQKHITLAVVEKVRVAQAGELPFYVPLEALGVKADERLPFDCMAWFFVSSFLKK